MKKGNQDVVPLVEVPLSPPESPSGVALKGSNPSTGIMALGKKSLYLVCDLIADPEHTLYRSLRIIVELLPQTDPFTLKRL